ncbi:type I glyceraldehyde-3-phosphate dehydrogenase [Candidatus Pacearchaeota archaeon CG1_02_32_21]|nr:MAG: type I glyceraldehyde-3-phosphate dehydrogenase [Candidatus Pacearchaeota archaeon CG1_02_32_21]
MKIAINGFGRIGRIIFKIALEKGINIVAINDIHGAKDAAYLLKYDTVYGRYNKKIKIEGDNLVIDGKKIAVLNEQDPEKLPWSKLGVDLVIESSGVFTDREGASKHFKAGAKRVIVTAPGKNMDITIVPGVNDKKLNKKHKVISVASCTTNCVTPILKILNDTFEIKNALLTTNHAYTSNQGILDGFNKHLRRGRAAAQNIVPASTGASEAIVEALPELKGKVNGMAIRVPVADGSLVDVVADLKKNFTVESINNALKKASDKSMKGIVEYSEDELVSSDIIGNPHSAIVDSLLTLKEGSLVKVLAWYDNEYGYSNRVVDVINILKKV